MAENAICYLFDVSEQVKIMTSFEESFSKILKQNYIRFRIIPISQLCTS